MPDADERPVIIEAAINGGTRKEAQPHVPRTVEEVTTDIEASIAAGASIVHNHPGDGASGLNGHDFYEAAWRPVLRARPDALLYPTFGFGGGPGLESQWGHVPMLHESSELRIAPVDPGSVNLGGADDSGLPVRTEFVYSYTPALIREQMDICVELGLGPHFSIFEPGYLRVVLAYYWTGQMPPGAMIRLYFSGPAEPSRARGVVTFGLPPTRTSLDAYLAMLEGCDLPWSVAVLRGDLADSELPRLALERGGHLRVGLEDFFDWAGERTPTNKQLVREMVELCDAAGRPVASIDDACGLLGMPPRSGG